MDFKKTFSIALTFCAFASQSAWSAPAALEVGTDDFQISHMGADGNISNFASTPAVAYNAVNNEYFIVWQGNNVGTEDEIFGRRMDAKTGEFISDQFQISTMGPDGDSSFGGFDPDVVYNSTNNQYLVVWYGDAVVNNEVEIYGRLIDGANGDLLGQQLTISDMGPASDVNFTAQNPSVAYNSENNEYLVVWTGDDNTGGLVDNEYEIFGQRLDGVTGASLGDDDFRISDMGPDGSISFGAFYSSAVYNPAHNEYLVLWIGDDAVDDEFHVMGQRLDAATGSPVGDNDFQISQGDADLYFNSRAKLAVYLPGEDRYLATWGGLTSSLTEYEVHGRLLDASGTALADDIRISHMGPDGDNNFYASDPFATYNSVADEVLLVWVGDNETNDEFEIFAQRFAASSMEPVGDATQISHMGPDGSVSYQSVYPQSAFTPEENQYLVVWKGDDDTPPMVNDEYEIFGQRLSFPSCGNGVVESSGNEECDDGNTTDGDCCSSTCTFEAAASSCDDGDASTVGDQCDGAGLCEGTPIVSAGSSGGCSLMR